MGRLRYGLTRSILRVLSQAICRVTASIRAITGLTSDRIDPKAPSMVIIEVKRDWDGYDRLLGEHRWNEMLRNPSHEEEPKFTQVFYCRYNSGRLDMRMHAGFF